MNCDFLSRSFVFIAIGSGYLLMLGQGLESRDHSLKITGSH